MVASWRGETAAESEKADLAIRPLHVGQSKALALTAAFSASAAETRDPGHAARIRAPDSFDEVIAAGRLRQLLAKLADEDVDDLEFRLVHPTVEMVEEHFLGERRALAKGKQLEHLVFFAGEVNAVVALPPFSRRGSRQCRRSGSRSRRGLWNDGRSR